MINKILFLAIFAIVAHAKIQNVELIADDVSKKGEISEAVGNVIVYSQDYFLTAKRAVYDEKNGIIELFGNVNSMRGMNETSRANYVKIDTKTNSITADANFLMDKDAEIWMRNDKSCSDEKYYSVEGGEVSSCNVDDPDWRIKFSSGKLNKESKFLHLYNPRFYLGEVPVLYLPYFGFPTDTTRRTGLLPPELGYLSKEGGYYKQPIYFAPYDSWDFELEPQIRTRRGVGVYGTFRFADSPYSYGEIRGGVFDNKKHHQERLEYKNEKHHGFEVEYDRSRLAKYLVDGDFKENLWINFTKLNDLEYYDLKEKNGIDDDADNALVTSKLNYYITNDDHYGGIYGRYYIDTSKLNSSNDFKNSDTVQELPTLQYHKFTDSLLIPNLLYSVDAKAKNFTRKNGTTATQYEFDLPVTWNTPLFDELLNFSITERLYMSSVNWDGKYNYIDNQLQKDDNTFYANHYTRLSLYSDLAKPYDDFYHTFSWGVDLTIPGFQKGEFDDRLFKYHRYELDKENGKIRRSALANLKNTYYYEDNFLNQLDNEYTHENILARMTQYFYDADGRKFIRHSVKQRYDFDEDEFGNLDHRIDFYFKNGLSLGNRFEYSHKFDSFDKVQSYVKYKNSDFSTSFSHYYKYDKLNDDGSLYTKDNYFIANASVNLPDYYKLFGSWEYDLDRSYAKMWRLGVTHNRKCWNYSFIYQEDIEPKNVSNKEYTKAKKEHAFYFLINFYPFGGVGYDFSIDTEYGDGVN